MKNYVKVVQAVQYLGDIKVLKDVLAKKDVIIEDGEVFLLKHSGNPNAGHWRLAETDFVVKEDEFIFVYKEKRFLAEFDEVDLEATKKNIMEESAKIANIPVVDSEVMATTIDEAGTVKDVSKVQELDLKPAPKKGSDKK